ncbi:NUDIX hydrolase [Corynebacterium sp. TAE3-ERU12]|uniref:NUDIX hydrolase n=1 Tax=Corynebacterium sp. TAE3-ERU12 TaxID=2849491 RepID=UPI001C465FF4|nr:NUDIX hydrolase [Corynebacterium sp. TAE3-ERU12]MBV7295349.1 NUDIX hydrolase [Corynebacterium sp. TAE3-ERU12]
MIELPVWVLFLAIVVVIAVIAGVLASAAAQRLNRMHVRCDLARASLEAALGRRAAVARAAYPELGQLVQSAESQPLTAADPGLRADAENRLTAAIEDIAPERTDELSPAVVRELNEARVRVDLARRFYNEAVTDTRALRRRPMVKYFRLAGTAPRPQYFDAAAR